MRPLLLAGRAQVETRDREIQQLKAENSALRRGEDPRKLKLESLHASVGRCDRRIRPCSSPQLPLHTRSETQSPAAESATG